MLEDLYNLWFCYFLVQATNHFGEIILRKFLFGGIRKTTLIEVEFRLHLAPQNYFLHFLDYLCRVQTSKHIYKFVVANASIIIYIEMAEQGIYLIVVHSHMHRSYLLLEFLCSY